MKIYSVMFEIEHKKEIYTVNYRKYGNPHNEVWEIMVESSEAILLKRDGEPDCRPCMVNAQRELAAALDPSKRIEERGSRVSLKHRKGLKLVSE